MAKGNKGSPFERHIAKTLSLWLSEGEDDSWVWRTSQSGGRATTRAKKGDRTSGAYGDLTFTDQRASWFFDLFSCELKCGYKQADLSSTIDSQQSKPQLLVFWEQCLRDVEASGAHEGMLILKRDRKRELVIISRLAYETLDNLFDLKSLRRIEFHSGDTHLIVVRFLELFEIMDPQSLKEELHCNTDTTDTSSTA